MQLRARWNSVSAKSYSAANTLACSSVALIPVRSLPLLQDVKRSPAINKKMTILICYVYTVPQQGGPSGAIHIWIIPSYRLYMSSNSYQSPT